MNIYEEVERKVVADHEAVMGKVCLCRYIIGYVGDSDDQTEIALDPPVLVVVDGPSKPEHGLFHDTGDHMDPYWDVTPIEPVDPRVANVRSCFSHGPSYDLNTGEMESRDKSDPMVWLAPVASSLTRRSWEALCKFFKGLMS
jgi:hypothetical protein